MADATYALGIIAAVVVVYAAMYVIARRSDSMARLLSAGGSMGGCERCGISWSYREHMEPVAYNNDPYKGSFPLCQDCFDACSAPIVTEYFRGMIERQLDEGKRSTEITDEQYALFEQGVRRRKLEANGDGGRVR